MDKPEKLHLRILLPQSVFLDIGEIESIQVATEAGSYGFLPQRLDCVTSLAPGLLQYTGEMEKEHYVAFDQGILTKTGKVVTLAVRNAITGTDLGTLHTQIRDQYKNLDEEEQNLRRVMAHLESGFIRNFERLLNR